jgi:predicted MPP superfamily phosphohydrolase
MPPAPLSRELAQQAIDLKAKWGTWAKASRESGIPTTTLHNRAGDALQMGLTPLEDLHTAGLVSINDNLRDEVERLKAELAQAQRPKFTIRQEIKASASKTRLLAIGDTHDDRKLPKDRFRWMGAYARETKPDVVLQIGDMATCDSLNFHIPNESLDGKLKPSFETDMGSLNEALHEFGCDGMEKHVTLGNHERRLWAYEQSNPEMNGKLVCTLDSILKNNGWTYSPYGFIQYYGGVGFVHAALNTMGKTYGGKNCLPTIANDSVSDLVIGHSHRGRVHQAPKIGQRYPTTIIDLGCALPDGHIEDYAKHALNGWTFGVYDLLIQFGHIQSAKFISMAELEERYA